MQVKARITHTKELAPGTGVSYGHTFVAEHPMRIAVVGIGYADGVPRALSNRMSVLIDGQQVLDVTDIPQLQEGSVVTLLGTSGTETITADDWAQLTGTIPWEILCSFKHRLPRITLNPQEESAGQMVVSDRPEFS
jgi:alanine racemase